MKICEFLEYNIPAYKLAAVLKGRDGIIIDPIGELPENNGLDDLWVKKNSLLDSLAGRSITLSAFEDILQKYGWYISKVSEDSLHILRLNKIDNGYYDKTDSTAHGIYLHVTPVKPTVILGSGIKSRNAANGTETDGLTSSSRILYHDKRVYLWKLEDMCSRNPADPDKDICDALMRILRCVDAAEYGEYVYAVRLPAGLKTHFDNEYGTIAPARYVTQDIPPSYVRFVAPVSKLLTNIEYSEYGRVSALVRGVKD